MSERKDMNLTPEELRIQASLRGLGEVRAENAFREKLRQQFVSGDFAETVDPAEAAAPAPVVDLPRRKRRSWGFAVVPAIAAMLAIIFLNGSDPSWELSAMRGEGSLSINGVEVASADFEAVADLIKPEARIVVPEGLEVDVLMDGVIVLGVVGPMEFTVPTEPQKEPFNYSVVVHHGEFRIKTGPDFEGRQIVMTTTEGQIEIIGTTIAVFKNDDLTCVCVLAGTANIGKDDHHMDAIPAGMRKVMFADGRDPLIIPIEPGHEASLIEFEKITAHIFD